MDFPPYFISIDWGTTNFRLRLVKAKTLEIIWENQSEGGVKKCYEAFRNQSGLNQQDFYLEFLLKEIWQLPVEHQNHPIVASGMGSSNIGLCELPYADFPFDESGSTLTGRTIAIGEEQHLLLISGVRSETGMMRGEEVQAIGLEDYLSPYSKGVLLLPGTHSKHITYQKGSFYGLKNYMTGELFEVLQKNSILGHSIEKGDWDSKAKKAFMKGFHLGFSSGLNANLFRVRARHLTGRKNKKDNYFFLSGLLIGDELAYLKFESETVFLAAPGALFQLYKMGLEIFVPFKKLVFLDDTVLQRALLLGQRKMLRHYEK